MPKTIRQALVGLVCLLTLASVLRAPAALRAPSPTGAPSSAVVPFESDEAASAHDCDRALGRAPLASPAPPPVQRGSARARDLSVKPLAPPAALTTSERGYEVFSVRGCSTSGVWSRGARTRAELMVFVI